MTITVHSGEVEAYGSAEIVLTTPDLHAESPLKVTVTRDRDGASVLDPFGPDDYAGPSTVGMFAVQDPDKGCRAHESCTEAYAIWFDRLPDAVRPALDLDWTLDVTGFRGSTPPDIRITGPTDQ